LTKSRGGPVPGASVFLLNDTSVTGHFGCDLLFFLEIMRHT
jgi:hypothetical protein